MCISDPISHLPRSHAYKRRRNAWVQMNAASFCTCIWNIRSNLLLKFPMNLQYLFVWHGHGVIKLFYTLLGDGGGKARLPNLFLEYAAMTITATITRMTPTVMPAISGPWESAPVLGSWGSVTIEIPLNVIKCVQELMMNLTAHFTLTWEDKSG